MLGVTASAGPPAATSRAKLTELQKLMKQRILLLDGAYGTAFQDYKLEEDAYRGERFINHNLPLQGNHDILCLTRPDIVEEVHRNYLLAGRDIICTNTFNATNTLTPD